MRTLLALDRYNTALVKQYGQSAASAIYNTATYGSTNPPFDLIMQGVRDCWMRCISTACSWLVMFNKRQQITPAVLFLTDVSCAVPIALRGPSS